MKQLFFISTLFFLLGCTKGGGNIYLKGRAYNPVTGEGIQGVKITLVKEKIFGSGGAPGFDSGSRSKRIKEVVTCANGEYEIAHTGGAAKYKFRVELNSEDHDDYEVIGWKNNPTETYTKKVNKGKNDYDDLMIVPMVEGGIYVENVNCQGATDTVRGTQTYLQTGETIRLFPINYYQAGCYFFSSSNPQKYPEGDYRYDWHVIRNGVRTDSSRVFQVRAGQENLIEILY